MKRRDGQFREKLKWRDETQAVENLKKISNSSPTKG